MAKTNTGDTDMAKTNTGFEWKDLYERISKALFSKITHSATSSVPAVDAFGTAAGSGINLKYDQAQSLVTNVLKKLKRKQLLPESYQTTDENGGKTVRENVDPFSFFALFNYDDDVRTTVLPDILSEILGTTEKVPVRISGIPSIHNPYMDYPAMSKKYDELLTAEKKKGNAKTVAKQNAMKQFDHATDNGRASHVAKLWHLFYAAIDYASPPPTMENGKDFFINAFNDVRNLYDKGRMTLTSILYEMDPSTFLPLDANTRNFLKEKLPTISDWPSGDDISYKDVLNQKVPTGEQYLAIINAVNQKLDSKDGDKTLKGIGSFWELSYVAWENRFFSSAKDLLLANHQLVLTGAPGTGKTYTAKQVAKDLTGGNQTRIASVQFHPGYDYSDFVVGMKPILIDSESKQPVVKENGNLVIKGTSEPPKGKIEASFVWEDGTFKKIADHATASYNEAYKGAIERYVKAVTASGSGQTGIDDQTPEKAFLEVKPDLFVFLIDEINRADLSRVFGELFSQLEEEYRYRITYEKVKFACEKLKEGGKELSYQAILKVMEEDGILLPSGERLVIPENLYIIGTMNDIDKSVESMDFALRRRFAWKEIKAEDSLVIIESAADDPKHGFPPEDYKKLKEAMQTLNWYIRGKDEKGEDMTIQSYSLELGPEYELGGAYFAKFRIADRRMLRKSFENLWSNHIGIILSEYLRTNRHRNILLPELHKKFAEACGYKIEGEGDPSEDE